MNAQKFTNYLQKLMTPFLVTVFKPVNGREKSKAISSNASVNGRPGYSHSG